MDKKKESDLPITPALPLSNTPIFVPPSGPPQGPGPSKLIYAKMGEENIYRMCADFYGEIARSPIRPMFSEDLPEASRKIAAFLVGLLGGPPQYRQLYGNPAMRARHLPFVINDRTRQVWLDCFKKVLADAPQKYNFPEEHLPGFIEFLDGFSAWMVNRK